MKVTTNFLLCRLFYLKVHDLQHSGLTADLISTEIGCLGHFMSDTLAQMASASGLAKKTVRSLFEQAACIAVSYSEF